MIPHGTAHDRATAIAGLAVALVVLVSCGAAAPAGPTAEPLDGTYTASGGGGALPAVQALTARFHELHPETTWIVSESGSNSAIKLVLSKTIDVGFVSRALTDLEKQTVTGIPIGFSGTAVVVNAANPLSNLSKEDLRRIYTGEVTSWVDLGGSELMIRVGRATQHNDEGRGFHAPGTTGPFGSAAAVGRLLKFDAAMMSLGYLSSTQAHPVKVSGGGVLLYYLVYYSRHQLGLDFWKTTLRGVTGQGELDLGL